MDDTSTLEESPTTQESTTQESTPGRRGRSRLLRSVLRENAIFSLVTGVGLVVAAPWIDSWLGLQLWQLVVGGLGLIGYGVSVWTGSAIDSLLARTGQIAIAGDTGWVIGALAVVVFTSWLTAEGEIALLIISIPVLLFALGQVIGLRRLRSASREPSR